LQTKSANEEREIVFEEDSLEEKKVIENVSLTNDEIYSEFALADQDFPTNDSSVESETIKNLKTYNWYVQNPALEKFLQLDLSNIEKSQNVKDKLFVIGRNIYQSACGGSRTAIDTIENLRKLFTNYNDFVINHLYSGMLYEIYFDSQNRFRENNFKTTFINQVFSLQDNSRLKDSIYFINKKLFPYKSQLIFTPAQNPKSIKLHIDYEAEENINFDFGPVYTYHSIVDISINSHSIITAKVDEAIGGYYYISGSIEEVVGQLSVFYLIPSKQIELTLTPKNDDKINLKLEEPKRLKKLDVTGVLQNSG